MNHHIPERYKTLPPYTPVEPFEVLSTRLGRPIEQIIKLDANENPYGASPRARQALADLAWAHIYPDPESRALRSALAKFTDMPAERLMAGAGADELIDLLLRVLLEPGDQVITCPPTFNMYGFDTHINAGEIVEVPRRADFSVDIAAVEHACRAERARMLVLAAPNNPDGGMPAPEELDALLELPLLVVLDEAYIEFSDGRLGAGRSRIRRVLQRDNLVVLRTFSKWAGLAGLRVGYGAFPEWLLPTMWKAKQPYNVNTAASAAALASLEDVEALSEVVERLKAERTRLFLALRDIPYLEPFHSQANFVLCRVKDRPAVELKQRLLARGILVRYYNNNYLRDFIRISVGRPEHMDALIQALQDDQEED